MLNLKLDFMKRKTNSFRIKKYVLHKNIFSLKLFLIVSLVGFVNYSNGQNTNRTIKSFNHFYVDFNVFEHEKIKNTMLTKSTSSKTFQLFSHGKPGYLFLNNQWKNAEEISEWLSNNYNVAHYANLNIYGCNFAQGENGKAALAYLEKTLGLSIAASDDVTGADGDWKLEVGNASDVVSLPNYQSNLQCECEFRGDVTGGNWVTEADCTIEVCIGERIDFRGPSGGTTYEWTDAAGNIIEVLLPF